MVGRIVFVALVAVQNLSIGGRALATGRDKHTPTRKGCRYFLQFVGALVFIFGWRGRCPPKKQTSNIDGLVNSYCSCRFKYSAQIFSSHLLWWGILLVAFFFNYYVIKVASHLHGKMNNFFPILNWACSVWICVERKVQWIKWPKTNPIYFVNITGTWKHNHQRKTITGYTISVCLEY